MSNNKSGEQWLYDKAKKVLKDKFNLQTHIKEYKRIAFTLDEKIENKFGTRRIEIDVVIKNNNSLIFAEAKQYLSFQAVSQALSELQMKIYLLKTYFSHITNKENILSLLHDPRYSIYKEIVLGSNPDLQIARAENIEALKIRTQKYIAYLQTFKEINLFLLLFLNKDSNKYLFYKI
ncbi:hypothetical protein [Deferribacter abyssi]|uniref:hypothetical protein n=1 Tax=Deferribacter abyssi TaxID=213806 RepID=UPI003C252012